MLMSPSGQVKSSTGLWNQTVPFSLRGKLNVQAQLAGADAQTATIQQVISGNINISTLGSPREQMPMNSAGNLSITGSVLFSTEKGYMLRSESSSTMNLSFTAGDLMGNMNALVSATFKMDLISGG
jgi:hypothetical protein